MMEEHPEDMKDFVLDNGKAPAGQPSDADRPRAGEQSLDSGPLFLSPPAAAPAAPAASAPCPVRQPFRRRHPKTFFFLLLLGLLILAGAAGRTYDVLDSRGILSGPRLAVVEVNGMIVDSAETLRWIYRVEEDPSIKGVLLRINSPGGAVVPSQEIYSAVKRLKSKKPVVVSMGTTAASGGYYIAVAGDYLVANPSTLTGSIGVKMELTNLEELLGHLGVKPQTLSTGKLKDAGTPFRPMTQEERAYLDGLLKDMFDEFVSRVAEGRKMSKEAVLPLADGRAFTGRQALALGLVDSLGDERSALAELRGRAGVGRDAEVLQAPEPEQHFILKLLTSLLNFSAGQGGFGSGPGYRFVY